MIQSLLAGYNPLTDGTILVADDGLVIASNDQALIGEKTKHLPVVQALKENAGSRHLVNISEEYAYGIMLRQRDYYIYVYMPDGHRFRFVSSYFIRILYISLPGTDATSEGGEGKGRSIS